MESKNLSNRTPNHWSSTIDVDQLILDFRQCENLPNPLVELANYAVKLTLAPGSVEQIDIDRLRGHAWTDSQITIATQVISYFNYINRIADGLGIEPEEWMKLNKSQWLSLKGRDYNQS